MNRSLATVVLLASVSIAFRVTAAERSPDRLIEEGLHLRRDGRPAEALELFRQAHALAPSPRTFGQMGLVEASLRQWVEAENHLALSLANPDDAWVRKNRAFLDEALSLCRQHVGDLVVSGAAGVEVFVGGRSMGTLPAVPALRLAEGPVTVTAGAPGFQPFERTVSIQAGVRTAVAISLMPVAATLAPAPTPPILGASARAAAEPTVTPPTVTAPAAAPDQPKASTWHIWAGLGLAAVGAAAVGWGAYWIDIDGECPHGETCPPKPNPTSGTYETRTAGWIVAGVGAAALAGGAAIFFTRGAASSSSLAFAVTPDSLLLEGRF